VCIPYVLNIPRTKAEGKKEKSELKLAFCFTAVNVEGKEESTGVEQRTSKKKLVARFGYMCHP
jgi:hypothetical protein